MKIDINKELESIKKEIEIHQKKGESINQVAQQHTTKAIELQGAYKRMINLIKDDKKSK